MHYMQCVAPHSPTRHTLTLQIPLILAVSVMSAKRTLMVKGLMLHSGDVGITGRNRLQRHQGSIICFFLDGVCRCFFQRYLSFDF